MDAMLELDLGLAPGDWPHLYGGTTVDVSEDGDIGPVARRLAATERVLSIEDEADIAAFLRAYFRAAGYDLVHVDPIDTDEIIAALEEHRPDVVLLDVRLRGFSGLDAYRRMRSDERWAFTPVLVVSAHAANDPHFEAPTGLDAFVPKPFNSNVLADLVRERIDRAKELAEVGRSDELELLTQDYLEARLADEIALAGAGGTISFGLVQLRSLGAVVAEVGQDGLRHLVRTLVARAREILPPETVIGVTDDGEIAVVFPSTTGRDAYQTLRRALVAVGGDFHFAGGATVPVDVVGGVASYPNHAGDPDGLFMAADAALTDATDEGSLLHLAL